MNDSPKWFENWTRGMGSWRKEADDDHLGVVTNENGEVIGYLEEV